MAIPSPFDTQAAGLNTSLSSDSPAFQQYQKLRQAQDLSLQQHQNYAQGLQMKQQQVSMKMDDLSIADRLLKILDPNVNKAARQFLLRELAQTVGVDPKNDNFKAVAQMVGGLDPNTLGGVKGVIMDNLKSADPGQVSQLAKGLLSGTVPLNDLMGKVQSLTRAQALTQPVQESSGISPAQSAAPQQGGTSMQAGSAGATPQQQPQQAGGQQPAGSVMSFKEKRTFQPEAERVNPQFADQLGIGADKELRNKDFLDKGYTIPLDEKQQAAAASELSLRTPNMTTTLRDVGGVTAAIRETGASESYRTVSQRVIGQMSTRPGFVNSSGPGSEGWEAVEGLAQQKAAQLVKNGDPEAVRNTTNTLLNLSYIGALGGNIPGNKLTNGVLASNINSINSMSDMYSVAQGGLEASLKEYDRYTRSVSGQSGLSVMFNKSQDKRSLLSDFAHNAEILSPETKQEVIDIGEKWKVGQPIGQQIEPASPTLSEERNTLGSMEVQDEKGKIAERTQRMDIAQQANTRAEQSDKRAEDRLDLAGQREDRMAQTQADNQKLEREKFDWQKQKFEEQKGEQSRERIAKAFQHFGAAIAGSVHGVAGISGGGGGGGGQDSSAFRLNPAQQRTPPRPGAAVPLDEAIRR